MSSRNLTWNEAVDRLVQIAGWLSQLGWLPATAGNLSVLLGRDPLEIAVTASGVDKEFLDADGIVAVDADCRPLAGGSGRKPSFETQIHSFVYQLTDAGCVLHVHTIYDNLAGQFADEREELQLEGLEIIKALNVWEEEAKIRVPVVENYADITRLVEEIRERWNSFDSRVPCLLIRSHGIYVWGKTWQEAKKHLQALEFMFEYWVKANGIPPQPVGKRGV